MRWFEEQKDRVETQKKRKTTITTDGYKLNALMAVFADIEIASIGSSDVTRYQKARLQGGRKPPRSMGRLRS